MPSAFHNRTISCARPTMPLRSLKKGPRGRPSAHSCPFTQKGGLHLGVKDVAENIRKRWKEPADSAQRGESLDVAGTEFPERSGRAESVHRPSREGQGRRIERSDPAGSFEG